MIYLTYFSSVCSDDLNYLFPGVFLHWRNRSREPFHIWLREMNPTHCFTRQIVSLGTSAPLSKREPSSNLVTLYNILSLFWTAPTRFFFQQLCFRFSSPALQSPYNSIQERLCLSNSILLHLSFVTCCASHHKKMPHW